MEAWIILNGATIGLNHRIRIWLVVSVALFLFTLNQRIILRWEGTILALGYLAYLIFVAHRG